MTGLPAYRATREHIEALIHPPQHAAAERLPMIKLTQAGDEVL